MQQTLKSLSLLFFPCKESSQQKVFRKVGVSNFLVEILEKHQRRISFFHIIAGCRATFLLQRLIKLASSYQRFQPEPQLATMQGCYFKKHLFSSVASVASVDYTVHYVIEHHCGQIYLAECVCSHLSLFSLVY